MVARRLPLREPALCLDLPSLLLGLSRFDDDDETPGEDASSKGMYCEKRGLPRTRISFAHGESCSDRERLLNSLDTKSAKAIKHILLRRSDIEDGFQVI
jgi:hypothetical protein